MEFNWTAPLRQRDGPGAILPSQFALRTMTPKQSPISGSSNSQGCACCPVPVMIASKCRDGDISFREDLWHRRPARESCACRRAAGDDNRGSVYWGNSLPDCSANMHGKVRDSLSSRTPTDTCRASADSSRVQGPIDRDDSKSRTNKRRFSAGSSTNPWLASFADMRRLCAYCHRCSYCTIDVSFFCSCQRSERHTIRICECEKLQRSQEDLQWHR